VVGGSSDLAKSGMAASNPKPVAFIGTSKPGYSFGTNRLHGLNDDARKTDFRVANPSSDAGSSSADEQ